jgi:hypothetical protein
MKFLKFIVSLLFILCFTQAYSQCSDAGVCIIGKKPNELFRKYKSSVSIGYTLGTNGGPFKIKYASIYAEANLQVSKFTNLIINMPLNFNSGPLGKASGPGDASIVGSIMFPINGKAAITLSLGGKFATGRVNAGDTLPQYYQPGLGTNDMLIGLGFLSRNVYVNIAYQKSFGRSANLSTRLKRGDDILLRAGYFMQAKEIEVKAEILTIKRLQKSSILIYGSSPEGFTEVDNSNQLQINLLAQFTYVVTNQFDNSIFVAVPLLKRDTNIDGLKRSISGGFSFTYYFSL